jgi:glycosyltransferase involved in cell wall biosynthesis
MKILFTYQFPFHIKGYGGGQQIIRGFAISLTKLGHDVYVICPGLDELGINKQDYPVKYIFSKKYSKKYSFIYSIFNSLINIVKIKPNLVCSFTGEASVVIPFCRLFNIKNSTYVAAPVLPIFTPLFNIQNIKNIRYNFSIFLQMIGVKFCSNNFIISNYLKKQLIDRWDVDINKCNVLGCGLSEIFFEQSLTNTVKYDFISIGRIALKQKPLDKIAEELSKVNNLWNSWTIIGTGDDEIYFKEFVKDLKIADKINFVGTKSSFEIKEMILQHKIVLLPSSYESFFITAYESLALNKIIITNDVADIKLHFGDIKNVIIVNNSDPDTYINAIKYSINLFNNGTKFNSYEKIQNNFHWDQISNKYLSKIH